MAWHIRFHRTAMAWAKESTRSSGVVNLLNLKIVGGGGEGGGGAYRN